jgi:hypothetical protein
MAVPNGHPEKEKRQSGRRRMSVEGKAEPKNEDQKRALQRLMSYIRKHEKELAKHTIRSKEKTIADFREIVRAVSQAFQSDTGQYWGECCCNGACWDTYQSLCPADCMYGPIGG